MKRLLIALAFLLPLGVFAQSKGELRYDTVVIKKQGGNSNLIIEDSSKGITGGVYYNAGRGLLRAKKTVAINDSAFIVGGDTVRLRLGGGSGLADGDKVEVIVDDAAATFLVKKADGFIRNKGDSLVTPFAQFPTYERMRLMPTAQLDTNFVYYLKRGKYLVPYVYDPNDVSSADDSASVIRIGATARLKLMVQNYVQPYMFGAYPDDGLDDQAGVQKMIDWMIRNSGSGYWNIKEAIFEGGVYEFSVKGFLVWKDANNDGQPEFTNIKLRGNKPVAMGGASGGETQLHATFNDGFVIGLERCKGCEVSNFIITGTNQLNYGLDSSWNKNATFLKNGHRFNRFSPTVGIVVDPFGAVDDSTTDRFPQWLSYYTYVTPGNGGSTVCIFRNNKVDGFAVGMLLSPQNTTQNNEGHWIENFFVSNVKYGYASTQSQERTVQIKNMYAWGSVHTVLDTRTFGVGRGEPPSVDGLNIAGGVYRAVNFQGSGGFFPTINITNLYAELLYTLGYSTAGTVFINPHVAFGEKEEYYSTYPALRNLRYPDTLYYGGSTIFINALLLYYNGGTKAPFNFQGNIRFIGGALNSQPGVRYNTISVEPFNMTLEGTGFYAIGNGQVNSHPTLFEAPEYNINQWMKYGQMFVPWTNPPIPIEQADYAVLRRTAISSFWKRGSIGNVTLTVSGDSATATIALFNNKTYLVNSLIWGSESQGGHLMRVRRVTGTTVCFDYLTESVTGSGTYNDLYIEVAQQIEAPIIATLTGSTSLTNVRQEGSTSAYTMPIGMYWLNNQMFFVTESAAGTATIENMLWSNLDRIAINTTTYTEDGFSAMHPLDNIYFSDGQTFKKGGIIKNTNPNGDAYISGWECTKTGMKGVSAIEPEFKVLYHAGVLLDASVTSSRAATLYDLDKLVRIDNTSGNVTFTISPSTFNNKVLEIEAVIPGSNTITITPSSGTINGVSSYVMTPGEKIRVKGDGTNLRTINP